MISALLSFFLLLISSSSLLISIPYFRLFNSFASLNYSLPNLWVVTDTTHELPMPLFDTVIVEETSIKHFKNNLNHILGSFDVGFYYFDEKTLKPSIDRYVSGVRISLNAKLMFNIQYHAAHIYTIHHHDN